MLTHPAASGCGLLTCLYSPLGLAFLWILSSSFLFLRLIPSQVLACPACLKWQKDISSADNFPVTFFSRIFLWQCDIIFTFVQHTIRGTLSFSKSFPLKTFWMSKGKLFVILIIFQSEIDVPLLISKAMTMTLKRAQWAFIFLPQSQRTLYPRPV